MLLEDLQQALEEQVQQLQFQQHQQLMLVAVEELQTVQRQEDLVELVAEAKEELVQVIQ